MKEFIEKLIGRLEEKAFSVQLKQGIKHPSTHDMFLEKFTVIETEEIIKELAEEYRNDKVCQTAIMYAKNLHKYGVQIDSIWETATQQSMALNQAYMRGRQDERDIFDQWQEKHINTSTDTSSGHCEWEYDEFEEGWQTDCGVIFTLHDSDKEITHFCPYCGKKVKVVE